MRTPPTARIVLADDHEAIRHGVRQLIERPDRTVVGEAGDGESAIELVEREKPELLIVDFMIPRVNGLNVAKRIAVSCPDTEILFYTMHDNEQMQTEMLHAGARGFVLKSDPSAALVAAVDALLRHKPFFSSSVSQTLLDSFLKNSDRLRPTLTDRERQVLQLIAEGMTNKKIGEHLDISVKTVETHRSALQAKINARSTADLVRYAIRNGIIEA